MGAPWLEDVANEPLHQPHALDLAGVEQGDHPSTFFNLEPWSKPDVDLLHRAVPVRAAVGGASQGMVRLPTKSIFINPLPITIPIELHPSSMVTTTIDDQHLK